MDDITALLMEKSKVVGEIAKKVMKRLREEVGEKGLKLSVTGKKGRKEQHDRVVWFPGRRAASMQEGRSDDGRQCGNAGSRLENQSRKLGSEVEKMTRKKCKVRFSLIKKKKAFQKNYMKVGVKKLLRAGLVPARTWRVRAVEQAPAESKKLRRHTVAAVGKKSTTSLSLFMKAFGIEVEKELSAMATQTWAEGAWIGKKAHKTQRTLVEPGFRGSDVETSERAFRSSDVRDP